MRINIHISNIYSTKTKGQLSMIVNLDHTTNTPMFPLYHLFIYHHTKMYYHQQKLLLHG